jgi:5-methylcytosine-specific restriction enzyme A
MKPPTSNSPVPFAEWSAWYSLARWRKRRADQLAREPFCKLCAARGVSSFATVADHVESHRGVWNDFWLGKLQSLCSNCHKSAKRLVDERGFDPMIGVDGMPVDRRHPAYRQREPHG